MQIRIFICEINVKQKNCIKNNMKNKKIIQSCELSFREDSSLNIGRMHDISQISRDIQIFTSGTKVEKPPLWRVRFHRCQKNSDVMEGFYTSCIFLSGKKRCSQQVKRGRKKYALPERSMKVEKKMQVSGKLPQPDTCRFREQWQRRQTSAFI